MTDSSLPEHAPARGLFITFEGIDGAGKSSQLEQTVAWLQARGHGVVQTREPGGTELAERLRDLVLHTTMDALTEALLIFEARRDHLQPVIEPALAKGDLVICDRFPHATLAYQAGGPGSDLEVLLTLAPWVQQTSGEPGDRSAPPDLDLRADVATH